MIVLCIAFCPDIAFGQDGNAQSSDTISGKRLGEVTVEMNAIEHKGSHDVVIITPALRKNANSISQVIGKLPGFRYDRIHDVLTYLGKENIKILVDSTEKSISQVKQLGHQRFSKIDVFFNPTGRYQDYDVLVNLHTKKNYEGFDFYAQEQGAVMPGGRNGKGKDVSSWDNTLMFNYVRDRLTLGVAGTYNWNRKGTSVYNSTTYPLNGVAETDIEQPRDQPTDLYKAHNGTVNIAADYKIAENHTISANASYVYFEKAADSHREMTVKGPIQATPYSETSFSGLSYSPVYNYNIWLYYTGRAGAWNIGATAAFSDNKERVMKNLSRSGGFNITDNRIGRGYYEFADADVTRSTSDGRWIFGAYYNILNFNYIFNRLETGERLTDSHQLKNRATLSATWNPSDRWNMRIAVGLQANRLSSGQETNTKITPRVDAYVAHMFTQKNWVRLYYSTTVDQPFLGQVTDYGQFTDSLMYEQGNPRLQDAPFHNVNVVFGLWNILTLRAKAGIAPRQINRIYTAGYGIRPDGLTGDYAVGMLENTSWKYWGFRVDASRAMGNWYVSANVGMEKGYASSGIFHENGVDLTASLYGTYYLPSIGLDAYALYNMTWGGVAKPQTNTSRHTDNFTISIQKTFLKNRLTVGLTYVAPLHITSGKEQKWLRSPAYCNYVWANNQFRTDNQIMLSVSYRIQKGQPVRRINRSKETD